MQSLLDPVFEPLLELDGFWVVTILSVGVSAIITLVYKFMTDQNLMKQLKNEMKELQKEMKELRNNPEKMMEVQRQVMQTNSKYMMQSMKSTLITFIPIILIFGWMNAHIAYEPIRPDIDFTVIATFTKGTFGQVKMEVPEGITLLSNGTQEIVVNKAVWIVRGLEGDYSNENALKLLFNDRIEYKEVAVTSEQQYYEPIKAFRNSPLSSVEVVHDQKKVVPLEFNVLGYRGGWLGTYILLSIGASMLLRKTLKVY